MNPRRKNPYRSILYSFLFLILVSAIGSGLLGTAQMKTAPEVASSDHEQARVNQAHAVAIQERKHEPLRELQNQIAPLKLALDGRSSKEAVVHEAAMGTFTRENSIGISTLAISDAPASHSGSLNSWTVDVTTESFGAECTITCPANVTVSNDPNQCGAVVNYPAPTTTGSCGTVTCSPASGSFFPKGTTTITCTSSVGPACSFTVTVNDTQPPTITCPANITQSIAPNQCVGVVNYPPPTVSDNCPGVGPVVCSPASGSFFPKGTTTVTCTTPDNSGNTASCTFTVTIVDTQPPTITCPANQTVPGTPDPGGNVVTYVVTASDNCPSVTLTCGPASGSFFPEGITTVTCTATDGVGNTATCSFRATVQEFNDPPKAVNDVLPDIPKNSEPRLILATTLTGNDIKGPLNESGQTLTIKTVINVEGGTVAIVAGNVVFTPTPNYSGPAIFTYTVEDNGTTNGSSDPKTSGPAVVQFNITESADTPSVTNATTTANTQTTSGLVITRNPADSGAITHFKITNITGGTLFKNNGTTVIPNGSFITVGEGNAGLKFTPSGATNGSFLVQASTGSSDAGLGGATVQATIFVNPLGGSLQFSAANYSVAEGAGFTTITVQRTGNLGQAVTVEYASSDHSTPADSVPCTSPGAGYASSRCDFTTATGTLRFAAGETSKTFNVLISNDNYVEGPEILSLTLSNPTGGADLGSPSTAILSITDDASEPATNPIDNSADFVRAQYHDILNREPDAAGLAFWTNNIEKCNDPGQRPPGQTVAQCKDKQRELTAIAFFVSPEFQITGGFVYHLYKGSLTGAPNYDGGSAGRFPTFLEFVHDMSLVSEGIIVGGQISGPVVEANRNALAAAFVARPEFVAKYGALNNTMYVQELFNTTGIAASAADKQALVDGLTGGTETRASVLRKVVDGTVVINESNVQFTTTYGEAFINQENRRLFVFQEYIGYLRRNPDAPGFVFWLGKLNFFNGDPVQAEMVRSFILSPEYRNRFGQP